MTRVAESDWQPSDGISLDEQTLAIVKAPGSAAIIAGPGAGKTELLAQRASFLLQTDKCPAPRRILAISFKRDAAKNLTERVRARVGLDLAARMESYTFDAFSKGLVDRFSVCGVCVPLILGLPQSGPAISDGSVSTSGSPG